VRRGTTRDGPKVVYTLEGFQLPNNYSPAEHWLSIAGVIAVGWLHLLVTKTLEFTQVDHLRE